MLTCQEGPFMYVLKALRAPLHTPDLGKYLAQCACALQLNRLKWFKSIKWHKQNLKKKKKKLGKWDGCKNIFQCFCILSQLSSRVIILYIISMHQGAAINMWGYEISFECMLIITYEFTIMHTVYRVWRYWLHVTLRICCTQNPVVSVISPYYLHVISGIWRTVL